MAKFMIGNTPKTAATRAAAAKYNARIFHTADNARLSPGPLEYALLYTHPSDAERVRTAMEWRAAHEHDR